MADVITVLNANGSFEDGTSGWSPTDCTAVQVATPAGGPAGSVSSLQVTPADPSTSPRVLCERVAVEAGQTLGVQAWMYAVNGSDLSTVLYWYVAGTYDSYTIVSTQSVAAGTWLQFDDTVTVPDGVDGVRMAVCHFGASTAADEFVADECWLSRIEHTVDGPLTLTPAKLSDASVQFMVSGGKTPGEYLIETGDGGTVPVTLDGNGSGISDPYTYTMPGDYTVTASLTVPVTPPYADWTAFAGGLATWTAAAADVDTWEFLSRTSETATAPVDVFVSPDTDPWPGDDKLTLTAVVSDTATGHNLADFTLTGAKAPAGTVVQLDPGDGTTTVPMTIGEDGTATASNTYLHAGRWVYTATVTVPITPRYATWADVPAAVATWGAFVADTESWYYAAADSETATCQVEVFVGNGAIWATAIDTASPPYVQIDTWANDPADVVSWTVTRYCPAAPAMNGVIIYSGSTHSGAVSLQDHEAPFGVPITYTLRLTYADGTEEVFTSNVVTLTGGPEFGGCWISDPSTGSAMRIIIQEWTSRERAARQAVLNVMNRADPVVLSDLHVWPSGEILFGTRTQAQLVQARSILMGSRIILVRSWAGSSIEAAYMAVGDISEDRVYAYDPYAWDRSLVVSYQEVRPVPATARDLPTMWSDVYTDYATWADVDAAFPSWTDVIQWNPDNAFPATARSVVAA